MRIATLVILCPLLLAASSSVIASTEPVAPSPAEAAQLIAPVLVSGEQPGPGMWKISKGNNVLWIMGTQSPVPQKMVWRAKGIESVVAQSQEILGGPSITISVSQIGWFRALTMLPSAMQVRKNPDGATLKEIVPPALYKRWEVLRDKYIDESANPDNDLERLRPMFAALELYNNAIRRNGMTSSSPVWEVVRAAAKKHKVAVTEVSLSPEIKDPRGALKEFTRNRLPDVECFERTIDRIETDLIAMRERANAWAQGDVAGVLARPFADQRAACDAAIRDAGFAKIIGAQELREQSEALWMKAAEAALAKNSVTLAVLSISSLLGSDGTLARFKARGYAVEEPDGAL